MFRWFGRLLLTRRSDQSYAAWHRDGLQSDSGIILTSPAFDEGGSIPRRHAGRGVGDNISPELRFSGVPSAARHLVLVMEDVDAPLAKPFVHSLTLLDPDLGAVPESGLPRYRGPRPIPGHDEHHYWFELFAVDAHVDASSVERAYASMSGHVLARGRLVGTYER